MDIHKFKVETLGLTEEENKARYNYLEKVLRAIDKERESWRR